MNSNPSSAQICLPDKKHLDSIAASNMNPLKYFTKSASISLTTKPKPESVPNPINSQSKICILKPVGSSAENTKISIGYLQYISHH